MRNFFKYLKKKESRPLKIIDLKSDDQDINLVWPKVLIQNFLFHRVLGEVKI